MMPLPRRSIAGAGGKSKPARLEHGDVGAGAGISRAGSMLSRGGVAGGGAGWWR